MADSTAPQPIPSYTGPAAPQPAIQTATQPGAADKREQRRTQRANQQAFEAAKAALVSGFGGAGPIPGRMNRPRQAGKRGGRGGYASVGYAGAAVGHSRGGVPPQISIDDVIGYMYSVRNDLATITQLRDLAARLAAQAERQPRGGGALVPGLGLGGFGAPLEGRITKKGKDTGMGKPKERKELSEKKLEKLKLRKERREEIRRNRKAEWEAKRGAGEEGVEGKNGETGTVLGGEVEGEGEKQSETQGSAARRTRSSDRKAKSKEVESPTGVQKDQWAITYDE